MLRIIQLSLITLLLSACSTYHKTTAITDETKLITIPLELTTHLGDQQQFVEGDEIQFLLSLGQDAYIYMYYVDAANNITQILPNENQPSNFYMLGTMGLCSSIGLGLALAQPKPVIAIDGDGSVLTNLGTLATIGNNAADNFILLIIDNGSYGSTGDQPTYAGGRTSLAAAATVQPPPPPPRRARTAVQPPPSRDPRATAQQAPRTGGAQRATPPASSTPRTAPAKRRQHPR